MADTTDGSNAIVEGRLVWLTGKTVFEPKQKLDQNKVPRLDRNNKPMMEYGGGLAVPKMVPVDLNNPQAGMKPNPMLAVLWEAMQAEAFKLYPSRQLPPGFAMKYKDGDGTDHNGVSFQERDGQAGHLVFACTTTIQPKFFRWNGAYQQVNEGIKCGDYVRIQLNVVAHPPFGAGKAGLYLNPMMVLLLQEGPEIVNTPSGEAVFGAAPQIGYAGALPMPQAPQGPMPGFAAPMPAFNQTLAVPQSQGFAQPPVGYPAPAQPAPAQPHFGIIPQQFQPAPQPQYQQPMMPPVAQQPMAPAPFPQYQQPGAPVMPGLPGFGQR